MLVKKQTGCFSGIIKSGPFRPRTNTYNFGTPKSQLKFMLKCMSPAGRYFGVEAPKF